jgi:hypothetical protein
MEIRMDTLNETLPATVTTGTAATTPVIPLPEFIKNFGDGLLDAVRRQNPPVYDGTRNARWDALLDGLQRRPFDAQRDVVQAMCKLLIEHSDGGIINGEMGTGKTLMGICVATILHHAGYPRTLVIAPPHLVYKWRREIRQTVPNARVWILNGPDTLRKLLQLREMRNKPAVPEFFILGRVRMRMGFNWTPAFARRAAVMDLDVGQVVREFACCASCGSFIADAHGNMVTAQMAPALMSETRMKCVECGEPLWTLSNKGKPQKAQRDVVRDALMQIPTIGEKRAEALLVKFGEDMLGGMLSDNVFEFINLMDENGDLVFSDQQAKRIERSLASTEISFGQGGYQPTEFVKRYLPQGYFGLLIADEGHEYKNEGSAQGQAMGVLARKAHKVLALTGTLMGGYAEDVFYLLYRLCPKMMIEDGFNYNSRNSLHIASAAFMREHGVLIDIHKETSGGSHRTAKGDRKSSSTVKGPGFGPKGIMRYVVPYTAFLKLSQIGGNVLPAYDEKTSLVHLSPEMSDAYRYLESTLKDALAKALRGGDKSLLGVVLNALLAWPECCFRQETVVHPHRKNVLASLPALFASNEPTPKEAAMMEYVREAVGNRRRVLLYTTYTGTRDTTARLKNLLETAGFRASVLRASVAAEKREDWVMDQVDRGIDVLITNPELVKTGLDLLEFPDIGFLQTGFNTYTLQQAARRSWRIGQKQDVGVRFFGYHGTAQMACLSLMAQKIAISQSTSGDMPESGLDILNQGGDSIEVALAKQLVGQG